MTETYPQYRLLGYPLAEPWADTGTSTGRLMIAVRRLGPTWNATLSAPAPPSAAAGRKSAGSAWAGKPKLAEAQQDEARRPRSEGSTLAELAPHYGVGKSTISRL
jgi:hypothetical protein